MSDPQICSPDCPKCGHPPHLTWILPYFCSNEDCDVVTWDPTQTLAEIRRSEPTVIDMNWLEGKPPEAQ